MPVHGTTMTQDSNVELPAAKLGPVPGVLLVFANQRPRCRVFRWDGAPIELGRLDLAEDDILDPMISRKHVSFDFDGLGWRVADLGSRNRTFVRGKLAPAPITVAAGSTIRIGGALMIALADTLDIQRYGLGLRDGVVGGALLRKALETVAHSSKTDMLPSLLLSGESGTGKEIAARVFHESGPSVNAPFVAVNCATIPKEIAERLLFGSRRGAFSGATDARGHVQAANGGTLFLDEIAELPLDVQAKLLRMLETREVLRLGATSCERVKVRVCAATWRNLRQEVAAGRFREDLYFRIGQPQIHLPPLRERIEEIPWHVQHVLDGCGAERPFEATADFIESCAMRAWPGNVRELRSEVRRCVAMAGARDATSLTAEDLAPTAGTPIGDGSSFAKASSFPQDEIAGALAAEAGNVLGAARRLGIHRNKVRRWLDRYGVDTRYFKG